MKFRVFHTPFLLRWPHRIEYDLKLQFNSICSSTQKNPHIHHFPGVPQLYQYSEPTAVTANSSPRIQSQGEVFRAEVGDTLLLPCKVANLGPMILLWKKGTRVLTAGAMKVRRDKRINLQVKNWERSVESWAQFFSRQKRHRNVFWPMRTAQKQRWPMGAQLGLVFDVYRTGCWLMDVHSEIVF